MNILDYLHPLLKHGYTKDPDSVFNATINALNAPLDEAENDILKSKTDLLLAQSSEEWLDYFGEYLGLMRKEQESDDDYRKRLMQWVLVEKNDVSGIRNAIANFLEVTADHIYVYEPYHDIFYYNYVNSLFNSLSFYSGTYYNYCVIDVQIDSSFPFREVADIINLFRPAGVLWVVTTSIHSFSKDAPIIDMGLDGSSPMEYDKELFDGFNKHISVVATPMFNDDIVVTNPFFYNVFSSLWNEGKVYQNHKSQFNDYMTFGTYYTDYTPDAKDEFSVGRTYTKNYDSISNKLMSIDNNICLKQPINSYNEDKGSTVSLDYTFNKQAQNDMYGRLQLYNNESSVLIHITYTSSNKSNKNLMGIFRFNVDNLDNSKSSLSVTCSNNDNIKFTKVGNGIYSVSMNDVDNQGSFNIKVSNLSNDKFLVSDFNFILLDTGIETPEHYLYKSGYGKSLGIGGCLDMQHLLVNYGGMTINEKTHDITSTLFPDSYLTLKLKNDLSLDSNVKATLQYYNFTNNLWVDIDNITINNTEQTYLFKLGDLTNYVNDNRLFFYRLVIDDSRVFNIETDYIAFSFDRTDFNNPPLSWYYDSMSLINKTNFMDNQIGDWLSSGMDNKTLTLTNDKVTFPYSVQLSSTSSNLSEQINYNVVPGTVYDVDIWLKTPSGATLMLVDNLKNMNNYATVDLKASTDYEQYIETLTIPDKCYTCQVVLVNKDSSKPMNLASIKITRKGDE